MEHTELNSVSRIGRKHNMAEIGKKKSGDSVSLFSSAPVTNCPALEWT